MDINFLLVLENILKDIYHNLYETDKLIEKLPKVQTIINRNKKYIINLAVAESVKYGANVY